MMVSEYDTDGDGSLNEEELAEAEAEFEDAKLSSMDTNGDSNISEEERKDWRSKELPGRKDKRQEHFKKSCEKIGKSTEECRMMRDERKQKHKEEITTRIAEFDTDKDGKLNPEERKAMKLALDEEREKRRDDFVSKHDKDGDGKIGPKEKEARKEDREGKQGQNKSPPPAKK